METSIVNITPELANKWLQNNSKNRKLNYALAKKYAADMKAGRWSLNHQGIAFTEKGKIADGQHRLTAIMIADTTVKMMVTHGLPDASGVDELRPRSTSDIIKINGLSDWIDQKAITIARSFANLKEGWQQFSTYEIMDICELYKESIIFVGANIRSSKRKITQAPTLSAIAAAHSVIGNADGRLSLFCEMLISGMIFKECDSAVIKLREYLLTPASSGSTGSIRKDTHLRTQRAIKAFINKEKISRLHAPKDFIFDIVLPTRKV